MGSNTTSDPNVYFRRKRKHASTFHHTHSSLFYSVLQSAEADVRINFHKLHSEHIYTWNVSWGMFTTSMVCNVITCWFDLVRFGNSSRRNNSRWLGVIKFWSTSRNVRKSVTLKIDGDVFTVSFKRPKRRIINAMHWFTTGVLPENSFFHCHILIYNTF